MNEIYLNYPALEITVDAGEALSKGTVVYYMQGKIYKADSTNLDHSKRLIGILKNSTENNVKTKIVLEGLVQNKAWNWIPDIPIFLGLNGGTTQTSPEIGFIKILGKPISKTQVIFKPETSIILR